MSVKAYLALTSALVLACGLIAVVSLRRAHRRLRSRRISDRARRWIHPPANPRPIDLVARAMHERARERIQKCPAWEDLDPGDTRHAGLIRVAYERAREFIAMSGEDEE